MQCMIVPVTPFQQNCSLLKCPETGDIAVVDPGGDLDRIDEAVAQLGGQVAVVLLTHGHLDHCAAADQYKQRHQVSLIGPHKDDAFWIDQLPDYCKMAGFPQADAFTPDRWLEEGDRVEFGQQTLEVIHAPGHTPGHLVFYSPQQKLAVVGDVLFQGSIGRTDFPRSNHDDLISSITEKLWPLGDDVQFIPGHGPCSTFGAERQSNPFVADSRFG